MGSNAIANLVGVSDICRMATEGTTASTIAHWRKTHEDFPENLGYIGGRPVYRKSEVSKFLKRHGALRDAT